ncbi:DUF1845 domain-containing protein [uncultured Vibrio sp.]|uniref:DUF1845 domain-containing protein n=1 Tax=uncultured Vibrio sp. TaxID=114054 RepID=UPI0026156652|nr:DUF1845 domain-containing protein [uncultured Vibrio sp.]
MKLRSQRLLNLWDSRSQKPTKNPTKKKINGQFIFESLFSVHAFSTQPTPTAITGYARQLSDKLLIEVRALRDQTQHQHRVLINKVNDIDVNTYQTNEPQPISINEKKLTPQNVMLMKLFMATDAYLNTLYLAKINGELTNSEQQDYRQQTITDLVKLLQKLNKVCITFHQFRKNPEGVA